MVAEVVEGAVEVVAMVVVVVVVVVGGDVEEEAFDVTPLVAKSRGVVSSSSIRTSAIKKR